jgi:hypothetical protein
MRADVLSSPSAIIGRENSTVIKNTKKNPRG